jgi:hypothetical protein
MLDKYLPPTDNLYKFLAISGLLLIVVSFIPNYFNFQLWEQKVDYLRQQKVFIAEIEKFNKDYEALNKNLNNLNQKYGESTDTYKVIFELQENLDKELKERNYQKAKELYEVYLSNKQIILEKKKVIDELKANIDNDSKEIKNKEIEIETKKAELDKTKDLIELYDEEIARLKLMSYLLFILGIITAFIGFYFWYSKIQKFNDLILVNDAKEKQQEKIKKTRRFRML